MTWAPGRPHNHCGQAVASSDPVYRALNPTDSPPCLSTRQVWQNPHCLFPLDSWCRPYWQDCRHTDIRFHISRLWDNNSCQTGTICYILRKLLRCCLQYIRDTRLLYHLNYNSWPQCCPNGCRGRPSSPKGCWWHRQSWCGERRPEPYRRYSSCSKNHIRQTRHQDASPP